MSNLVLNNKPIKIRPSNGGEPPKQPLLCANYLSLEKLCSEWMTKTNDGQESISGGSGGPINNNARFDTQVSWQSSSITGWYLMPLQGLNERRRIKRMIARRTVQMWRRESKEREWQLQVEPLAEEFITGEGFSDKKSLCYPNGPKGALLFSYRWLFSMLNVDGSVLMWGQVEFVVAISFNSKRKMVK